MLLLLLGALAAFQSALSLPGIAGIAGRAPVARTIERDDIVGLESSIIMHPKVWEASGHVAGFTDPLVDCKVSKQRYRADQLFWSPVVVDGKVAGYVSALESEKTAEDLQAAAESFHLDHEATLSRISCASAE